MEIFFGRLMFQEIEKKSRILEKQESPARNWALKEHVTYILV